LLTNFDEILGGLLAMIRVDHDVMPCRVTSALSLGGCADWLNAQCDA